MIPSSPSLEAVRPACPDRSHDTGTRSPWAVLPPIGATLAAGETSSPCRRGISGEDESGHKDGSRLPSVAQLADRATRTLNSLAGADSCGESAGVGPARSAALSHIFTACSDLGHCPEEEENSLAAFEALRGSGLYQEEEAKVAPFDMTLVSSPDPGNRPLPLEQLWGDGGAEQVSEFIHEKLLSGGESRARLDGAPRRPYNDPALRRGSRSYVRLLRRLASAGMIEYAFSSAEVVGLFFTRKKSGRLRLVIDARRSNCWLKESNSVTLATGAALGEIQLEPGETLYVGHVDIKDAFYHFGLPQELRKYFGLQSIRASDAGVTSIDGVPVSPSALVVPVLTGLPMDWLHALFWCQSIHERLMRGVGGMSANQLLHDKSHDRAAKDGLYSIYVDNFLVFPPMPPV